MAQGTATDRAPAAQPGRRAGPGHAKDEHSEILLGSQLLPGDKSEPCEHRFRKEGPRNGQRGSRPAGDLCLVLSACPRLAEPGCGLGALQRRGKPALGLCWCLEGAPFVPGCSWPVPLPCAAPVPPQQRSLVALLIISRRDFWRWVSIFVAGRSASHQPRGSMVPQGPLTLDRVL